MAEASPGSRIAILGGGITGLTAAWRLQKAGLRPVVFEQSIRPGGAIGALPTKEGWLHELGPNSLLEGAPEVAAFIDEVGLGARRIFASPAARQRYIVRGRQLVALPTSPFGFIETKLFSWRAKRHLLGEPWRPRGPADDVESVADFVRRRLGQEFLDYAINPFVAGVYAGDPAQLSVRHAFPKLHALEQEHGSLIRGALKRRNTSGGAKGRIFSFPNGLEELPLAIVGQLGDAVRLQCTVRGIRRQGARWFVDFEPISGRATEEFAAVVSALPGDALAALRCDDMPESTRLGVLRDVIQPPVASVFTGYRREAVAHPLDGFGVLVPEVEPFSILGTLFSSTLFPGRAPDGCVGLTTFIGGTRRPALELRAEQDILQLVQEDLAALVGVRGEPIYTHIQRWPRAIPQYNLGYGRFKAAIGAVEAANPGFFVGGNCRDGISIANCIESGRRLAGVTQGYLRSTGDRQISPALT